MSGNVLVSRELSGDQNSNRRSTNEVDIIIVLSITDTLVCRILGWPRSTDLWRNIINYTAIKL